ncbi:hypothetical protein GQ53DRAFT_817322 [Thozetella sp. PMI_491]|nr:hypothetical protein GQ53DRAFT_817322 [Thozetella sp. PMI_491]
MDTVHRDELLSAADSAPTGDDHTNNIDFTLGLSCPASHLEPLRHFSGPVLDSVSDIPLAGSVRAATANDDGDIAPYDLGAWPFVPASALVPAQQMGLPFCHELTHAEGFSSGLSDHPFAGLLGGEDDNFGPSASVFRLNSFRFGLEGGDSTSSLHSSSSLGSRNVDVIPAFEFSSSPLNWEVDNPLQGGHEHGLTLWDARDLPVSTPQSLTSSSGNSSDGTASSTDPIPLVPRPETAYKRSK